MSFVDAVFGKKGSVDTSICNGVNRYMTSRKTKLHGPFDLRNELTQSGSRYI